MAPCRTAVSPEVLQCAPTDRCGTMARAEPTTRTLNAVGVVLDRKRGIGWPRQQPRAKIKRWRVEIVDDRRRNGRRRPTLRSDWCDGEPHAQDLAP